jgi:AraC-like DNA-binding protein
MISIRYFAPDPALCGHVSSFYWFESRLPGFADLMRAELGQIRLVVKGAATNDYAAGHRRPGQGAVLQGPTSGPVHYRADGPLCLFGIGLLPRGWAELVGVPADALADDAVDLAAVLPAGAVRALLERLGEAADGPAGDAARCAAVNGFLLARLAAGRRPAPWFTRLADDWLTASPNPDVDALVAASGMSARSVERLSKRFYGASPKLLARKYRALGAAVRLATGEAANWADAAGDAFYDQAHFIREFRSFTGLTPARFMVESAPVTRLTIARRRLLPGLPRLALIA